MMTTQNNSVVFQDKVVAIESPAILTNEEGRILALIYDFLKRVTDIICSLGGIIFFAPLMLFITVLIKLDSPGPVFADTPKRVGKKGNLFRMYKFRSMVIGAHDLLHNDPKYKDLLKKYHENSYKLSIDEDPRVTNIGKYIRKTSIDEMPQLFNILKGEMSLVGPRAYYPSELEEQQKKYPETKDFVKIILSAKPGLTGTWQISGRSEINFDKRVEMDAKYVLTRSIINDFWIILQTIPAVLSRRGAV